MDELREERPQLAEAVSKHFLVFEELVRLDDRFLRAALKPYVASRVVPLIDPELDAELITRAGRPKHAFAPTAYVGRGRERYAETCDADRLPAMMTRTDGTL